MNTGKGAGMKEVLMWVAAGGQGGGQELRVELQSLLCKPKHTYSCGSTQVPTCQVKI